MREAAAELRQDGVEARVLDMHTIKPVDEEAVERAARETGAIVTVEEHVLNGGLGSEVAWAVARLHAVPMEFVGIDNAYAESGTPQQLFAKYGLMPSDVKDAVNRVLARK
ncbi:MAG: transketolase C-terminal domain-containing protein [Chloroflexota bacterium]